MKIGQEILALHHFPLFKLTKIKYNKMIKEANLGLQVDFLRSKIIKRAHLKWGQAQKYCPKLINRFLPHETLLVQAQRWLTRNF